ncbi:hypothetical protein AwPolaro_05350 [Polaromonas sp.]|nr:hypothetical protein AwPolaro_05350 [Polaromonas sp.]
MENKAHALIAGAFIVLVTALLALLAVWLTRGSSQRDMYEMTTNHTVSGLQPQAPVRFRGVPVGKVERIGFDTKVKGNVLIGISIERGSPVTKSTFATVASQGVTGLGYIQLDDKGESDERLQPNDSDPPRILLKSGSLEKLIKQSENIFSLATETAERVNQVLSDDNQKAIATSLAQLSEASSSLNRITKSIEPVAAGLPALSSATSATIKTLAGASDEVRLVALRLNAKDGVLDKLAEGGTALTSGIETFSDATLPKIGEVADEATRAMRQLRRTVRDVDENPQAFLFGNGRPVPGPGEPGFSAKEATP